MGRSDPEGWGETAGGAYLGRDAVAPGGARLSDDALQPIRAWSRDKLDLLGKYLGAYATIMQAQRQRPRPWLRYFAYIDAFDNVGAYQDPESQELVDGSPMIALRSEPSFDEYWFIERSQAREERLRARVAA